MKSYRASLLVLLCMGMIEGCSIVPGSGNPDAQYKDAKTGVGLELPPQVGEGVRQARMAIPQAVECTPCANTAAATTVPAPAVYPPAAQQADVLPSLKDARMVRNANNAWLEVAIAPAPLWALVSNFVGVQGFAVVAQSPQTGTIETDWIDNATLVNSAALDALLREDIPTESLGLHRFSIRLERVDHTGSRVFVRHEGLLNHSANPTLKINDPELSARLMVDLLVYLGVEENRSRSLVTGS